MKQINVAVVGLSGSDKDKGQLGVGKSCLCNRFVQPNADDYTTDHISVLSQSDFNSRVVNNDHFLYWGAAHKTSDQGVEYNFRVIEQTEFIDDFTFQPLKVYGLLEPYSKRCTAVQLNSKEKLKYICRSQLAVEHEYEQEVLAGKYFQVDGFVCVFDVSMVPNRSVEKQVEFVTKIIGDVLRNRKPVVLVTTKNDDSNEFYVREAEKIYKKFKGKIAMVKSSAHENVNIDLGFMVLAQLIVAAKQRTKIISYEEAVGQRTDLFNASSECVARLMRSHITDHRSTWASSMKKLETHGQWNEFLVTFGREAGQKIFRRHVQKLREEHQAKKLLSHLDTFANVLQELIPDMNTFGLEVDWLTVRNFLCLHSEFDRYFCDTVERGNSWTELSDENHMTNENLIPFDVLKTTEAETVFKNHLHKLQFSQRTTNFMKEFLQNEESYVHDLERGIETYIESVMIRSSLLFDSIDKILRIHRDNFLPKLYQNQRGIEGLAETFIEFIEADRFYCYIMLALNRSQTPSKLSPDLDSFLLQPIHRLAEYKTLLANISQEVLKLATGNLMHSVKNEIGILCKAEKRLEKLVDVFNEAMSVNDICECYELNLHQQGRFRKTFEMDVYDRSRSQRYAGKVFVFDKCIICTEKMKDNLKYRNCYLNSEVGLCHDGLLKLCVFAKHRGIQEVEFSASNGNVMKDMAVCIERLMQDYASQENQTSDHLTRDKHWKAQWIPREDVVSLTSAITVIYSKSHSSKVIAFKRRILKLRSFLRIGALQYEALL